MISWRYNPKGYDPNDKGDFPLIPEGEHIAKLVFAEEKYSKTGKPMIEMTLQIKGYQNKVKYWMVFDPDNEAFTNQRIGAIWDSLNLPVGNLDPDAWIGKVGAVEIEHREFNKKTFASVKRFIPRNQQAHLYQQASPPSMDANFTSMRDDPNFAVMLNEPAENQEMTENDIPF